MTRAIEVVGRGGWKGEAADSVVLGLEDRRRRQGALKGVRGLDIELALADAVTLRTGDALKLEDGRIVEVVAAPEALVELRCADPQELARVAWHFGNRHVPIQILGQKLRLRDDADLAPVIAHLGLKATPIEAPFDPEGGAYAAETAVEESHGHACGCGGHHHDHEHDHGHAHHHHGDEHHHGHDGCCGGKGHAQAGAAAHAHDHAHEHTHDHGHAHGHAGGCCGGHGHRHGHGHEHGHGGCGCGGKG